MLRTGTVDLGRDMKPQTEKWAMMEFEVGVQALSLTQEGILLLLLALQESRRVQSKIKSKSKTPATDTDQEKATGFLIRFARHPLPPLPSSR